MTKFLQVLMSHQSFNSDYILQVLGLLCDCFNVAIQSQVRVHDHTKVSSFVRTI